MGTLVAKKYPTKLFLKAADHTYVECGNGAIGWACWGGKTGGSEFNRGQGSTARAGAIAEPDERAGITCYLVNGVCHQAANRILLPAQILVSAARGYFISSSIFGPYGKTQAGKCAGTFNQQQGVSGDIPGCLPDVGVLSRATRTGMEISLAEKSHNVEMGESYAKFISQTRPPTDVKQFEKSLFHKEISFRLGDLLPRVEKALINAKDKVDLQHEEICSSFKDVRSVVPSGETSEFIMSFNKMTNGFQDDLANALVADTYVKLTGLQRDERVVLADPDILENIYGSGVVEQVYPELKDSPPETKY